MTENRLSIRVEKKLQVFWSRLRSAAGLCPAGLPEASSIQGRVMPGGLETTSTSVSCRISHSSRYLMLPFPSTPEKHLIPPSLISSDHSFSSGSRYLKSGVVIDLSVTSSSDVRSPRTSMFLVWPSR